MSSVSPPSVAPGLPVIVAALAVIASLVAGYLLMAQLQVQTGDEGVHQFQVGWFVEGRYELFQHITMVPLYHYLLALLAGWSGLTDLDGLRLVHLLLATSLIPACFLLYRATYPADAVSRTLQCVWLPLLFPLFFVTYTDLPALALVLLTLERTLKRHYLVAGVFGLIAVTLRQPNIAWVAFAVGLVALQVARDGAKGLSARDYLLEVALRARYLLGVGVVFLVFVLWNRGVALGDTEQHPLSLNVSNLYFCLLVAWALFLPFAVEQLGNIRRLLGEHPWTWLILAGAFLLYFFTYAAPHKYNSPELEFYRHNLLIHYTVDYTVGRVLAFIPMAWMALAFATAVRASEYTAEMLLLAPFALLSFLPMPLIEPRYYLPALCLFLALRPPMSRAATAATFAYYLPASAWLLYNISRQNFFL